MIIKSIAGATLLLGLAAQVNAQRLLVEAFDTDPAARGWTTFGDPSLFTWSAADQRLNVVWDSSKQNSYFHLPLGQSLNAQTPFRLRFKMSLGSVAIGTNPEKPYTFQIALGLVRLANAAAPGYARGAGIGPENGPRNLVEFTYFPDSGFGATVAPTIISQANQYAASFNYPLELDMGPVFEVEMEFTPESKRLRTRVWRDGQVFGTPPGLTIDDAILPDDFAPFEVDALAISSYSDEGQLPPEFSGSVLASGWVDDVELTLPFPDVPALTLSRQGARSVVQFEGRADRMYRLEASADLAQWESVGAPQTGIQGPMEFIEEHDAMNVRFYRLRIAMP